MELYGNTSTYNLENVLRQNVTACDYYRNDCAALPNWQAVIDEIYNAVEHVEPWMGGNARGPSTAFCLLHRLFALRMSVEEITATLNHADSPFIRAVSTAGEAGACEAFGCAAGGSAGGGGIAAPRPPPSGTLSRCAASRAASTRREAHGTPFARPPAAPRLASCTCATCATPATSGTGSRPTWRTRRCAALAACRAAGGSPGGGSRSDLAGGPRALGPGLWFPGGRFRSPRPQPGPRLPHASLRAAASPPPPRLQMFKPSKWSDPVTMGDYVRDLLLDQVRISY